MSNFDIPALLVLLDEKDLALRYIEAQADLASNNNLAWAQLMPVMDPIRCEPRFLAAVEKVNVKDLRAATICAGKRIGP